MLQIRDKINTLRDYILVLDLLFTGIDIIPVTVFRIFFVIMFSYLSIALVSLVLIWLIRELLSLSANVAITKTAGLPYAIARELMTYFLYL